MVVLCLGADEALVRPVLERAGAEGEVIVLDVSPVRLEALERALRDPRVWYLVGGGDVIPLPDRSVDEIVGNGAFDTRVLR